MADRMSTVFFVAGNLNYQSEMLWVAIQEFQIEKVPIIRLEFHKFS